MFFIIKKIQLPLNKPWQTFVQPQVSEVTKLQNSPSLDIFCSPEGQLFWPVTPPSLPAWSSRLSRRLAMIAGLLLRDQNIFAEGLRSSACSRQGRQGL
jgi:hypothetical protein